MPSPPIVTPTVVGAERVVAPDASEALEARGARPNSGPIRGLIFELSNVIHDGTLWWRWLVTLLSRLHPELNVAQLETQWHNVFLAGVRAGRREFGESFESFLLSAGLTRGEIDEVLAAGLCRRRDLEFDVLPFPGVRNTLLRLHKTDVRLGILSDSSNTSEELCQRIARLGLGGCFSLVLSSVEIGDVKPAAICYESALARLDCPRDEVAFVGQSSLELAGAKRRGLRAVGFNVAADAECDHRLARFELLPELILQSAKA